MDELNKKLDVVRWLTDCNVSVNQDDRKVVITLLHRERLRMIMFCSKSIKGALNKVDDYINLKLIHKIC